MVIWAIVDFYLQTIDGGKIKNLMELEKKDIAPKVLSSKEILLQLNHIHDVCFGKNPIYVSRKRKK